MLQSAFCGKMLWATFISDVVPQQLQLWRIVSERVVIPLPGCWSSFGPLTHKEHLLWFSNCSPLFLLFPLPLLYTCLLICFSSIIFLLQNVGFYIPDSFSLSLHHWLHCPSCCWTHLHLCKEWEKTSTLQCSSHGTGVNDKIWDCQGSGLAQGSQPLSYACNWKFRKPQELSIFMLCSDAMVWNSIKPLIHSRCVFVCRSKLWTNLNLDASL